MGSGSSASKYVNEQGQLKDSDHSHSTTNLGKDEDVKSKTGINYTKRNRLKEMKVFVVDNSLRESTVGQVIGQDLNDKTKIIDAVRGCGFKHLIVGAFSSGHRVDDSFAERVKAKPDECLYAFSEDADTCADGCMLYGKEEHVPIALQKIKKYNIPNVIFEIDLADPSIDWDGKFPVSELCKLLQWGMQWTNKELPKNADGKRRNYVNLRDFPLAMMQCPERCVEVVTFLAKLPPEERPVGIFFEEPMGEYFPEEVSDWTAQIRKAMDSNGWKSKFQETGEEDGLLLVHVHKQWGMADAVVLDCLAAGADGMWCSICEEGAAMGHACSAVALANLARFGNQYVCKNYNTKQLAVAAREVHRLTTNKPVAARQCVYGPRAVESVFGFGGIAGGCNDGLDLDGDGKTTKVDRFSLASFLGVNDPPVRITSLASPGLVVERLKQCFGENDLFTEENAAKLLQTLKDELCANVEEEHSSKVGLAHLWRSAMGTLPEGMQKALDDHDPAKHKKLIEEAEACFKNYIDEASGETLEKGMDFKRFYSAYLQPFVGCFACPRANFIFDMIDKTDDHRITWKEWKFWCEFALRDYSLDIANLDDLHQMVLTRTILANSLNERK